MFLKVFFYPICLVVFIKSSVIPLLDLDSHISEICWGDKKISLDADNIPHILHCYDDCFKAIKKYEGTTKPTLYNKLLNNLACIMSTLNSEYYSGNIGYSIISEANKLLEDVKNEEKSILNENLYKSDCKTVREVRSTGKNKINPLIISADRTEKEKACETLLKLQKGEDIEKMNIPTPELDNNENPTKLKVPTCDNSAYRIDSPEAGVALTSYYKIVMKCLTLKNKHKHLIMRFNKDLYHWLSEAVVPHLSDDKFYPAFGGVLRILETMKACDFISDNSSKGIEVITKSKNNTDDGSKILNSKYFPIILMPWLVFLLVLIVFQVWRSLTGSKWWREYKDDNSSESDTAILFYPVEESTTISMTFVEDDESTCNSSSIKSDQKGYNTLGQTHQEFMAVPKKKKNRQGRKNGPRRNRTSSSSDTIEENPCTPCIKSNLVPPLYLDKSTSVTSSDEVTKTMCERRE